MRIVMSLATILIALFASAEPAKAAPILLFNTGVDNNRSLLTEGTVDSHYALIGSPAPTLNRAFVSDTLPPVYIPNGLNSKWIGPGSDLTAGYPRGDYTYRTTFDLTGYDPTTAIISGRFASDNGLPNVPQIFLNASSTSVGSWPNQFAAFTSFTLVSGFVSGLNTLDFRVSEPGGTPTALRVELSGTVGGAMVPEPSSLVLVGAGAALLLLAVQWGRVR